MSAEGNETPGAARDEPSRKIPAFPPNTNKRPELVTSLLCERDVDAAIRLVPREGVPNLAGLPNAERFVVTSTPA